MTTQTSLSQYEQSAKQFKPEAGLASKNPNDVRAFLYEWFTRFEHVSEVGYFLSHLDDQDMSISFPGMEPLTSHAAFTGWYDNLLTQTLWNFHDISALQIQPTAPEKFKLSFIVDWYGEVRPGSEQLAGWQSRNDSHIYHHKVRQTWELSAGDNFTIGKLLVTGADAPSPIQ